MVTALPFNCGIKRMIIVTFSSKRVRLPTLFLPAASLFGAISGIFAQSDALASPEAPTKGADKLYCGYAILQRLSLRRSFQNWS